MNTQDLTKRLMRRFTLLAGVGMMALQLQAQTFNILKEINTTATLGSISNTGMATVGDKVLFFSDDGINGQELWRTDGTPAGTQRLTDILPGAFPGIGASPQWAVGDGVFYFAASDASELWRSDGTEEGTYLLKFFGGTNRVSQMFFHNGVLYLVANDGINGSEPWISDGTPAGTVLLKDINPGSANSLSTTVSPYGFIAMGSNVYFAANNGANGRELWKTDGTTSGTILVKDVFSGTQGGINNMKAAAHNGKIYFAATNGTSGTELWATDGTDAGTYQVKDINPGSGSASPNNLITFNGSLFFSASNSNNNTPGLWKSDGTDAGTVLVKDLAADGVSLTVGFNNATNFFTVNGSKLYFRGGLATGSGLFASDGTTAGTGLVKAVGGTGGFFSFNGLLFFQGSGPESSNFPLLYKSDGTAGGTVPVFEGNLLSGLSVVVPQNLPILNDQLFFVGDSPENGPELWSTDGTNAGTKLIRDINLSRSGTSTSSQAIAGSASLNRLFLFTAGDEEHGVELWKTDGTTGGTALVKDIFPGKRSSSPSQFRTVGDQVFFMANNGITGNELWKTDGTEEGTRLVKDINPGIPDGFPIRLTVSGPYVYFIATHPDTGTEMWRSDGTEAGTTLVADLTPGSVSGFTLSNTHLSFVNKAFFINGITNKLYVADGNANTFAEFSPDIVAAYDMAVVGNALFIGGRNANGQNVLWRSNNGAAPVQYKVVRNTDGGNIGMYQFANCNGKLYFSANDGTTGSEPWVSDGTDAGTFRLKDIQTGSGSSQPAHFSASGNKVFFQARGTGTDAELWATDGTEVGTYLVKDINSGTIGSNPSSLLALPGGKILFTADNGIDGIELWQSDGNNAGTTLLRNFSSNGNGLSTASILLHFKENYVLWPLNNGVLFFARSADKGNQLYYGSIAPQGYYVNDNSTTADIFTTAIGNDANTGTFHAPFATIQHAVNVVPEGSTIYVDAGSYTEQVTITKGLTIKGAGKGLTMVNGPEGTLTRLPDFGDEPAIIQSTQNIGEVIIEDLAIDGSLSSEQHSILIQGSGRVANCEMRNANNGIFFREVNGGECIAEAIGNHIHNIDYVGILFAGTGMDARAFSNTIDLNGAIFGMGFLAGYGGNGSIDKLIAENNFVIDHNGFGFSVNAASATINYNSITAISGGSILNGTGVPIAATCNWFGSVDGAIITSRVSAGVQYIPWLTDGTDAEPGTLGFQPLPDVCNGEQINFYVNDNSTTDDTFTTAVGNDNNPGTSEAPFATIQKAVQLASEGTSIYVDAGSYVEQVTIGKGLTITCAARSKSFVTLPATTAPAPGPFMEQGTFQTTQDIGDVHLSGLSITGDLARSITPVIIQGGGSVRNSNLQGGNQGVFFRVETAAKTAEVESNIIQAEYIGVNFEGQAITASLLNNAIAVNNTGFSAGVFANGGGTFTATGNSISNYATAGISGGSTTNINNNSFAGAGGFAIQTYSTANATCNWFGTADEAAITAQLSGNVSFAPWLTNGTDADPGSIGFQPLNGVCNGGIVVLTVVLNSKQDVLCAGDAAGTINVTVSGGEAPYSYSWTKTGDAGYGADTEDLQNLTAGTYNLTVTDALDATANLAVTITQPALLLGNVSGTNVTCFNAADGTAMMNVSGGTSPYTYLWSTSAETAGISGLAPGTYSVTATDANGCTVAGSYTVTQPPALVPAVVVVNNTCATGTNGSLTVSANGGTAPYTYSLDGVNYQPGNVFSNLAAGNYMVYVQDAAGCIASANATLIAPPAIVIVPTSVTGTCAGTSNGNVDVTISGGTGRYSFAWTGPNGFTFNREDLTRVAAGTYTLVVTDANGCTATLAVEVVATPALVITGDLTPVPCFGTSTGAIDVRVSGGSGSGYTFVWSGPNGFKAATEDVSGLRAGSYTVTVTDAGGCSAAQAFTVSQPAAALTLPPPVRTDIAACDALGSITANATGGTAPYQYSLNGGALQLSNVFTNLPAANYSIQATDANGCTSALVNVSIVDNGTDAFEANNTVSAASNINIGQRIRARLAATKGADQDWYRFVTTATGSYAVSWTHPSVLQTFDLYVLNRNKAVLVTPTSVVGNTKNYANLAANTYHVQVNGTQSFVCYDLVVNSLSAPLLITSAPAVGNQAKSINGDEQPLSATAFPNPHRGSFTLRIESPVHGEGQVTLYDLTGRALTERKVLLQQGANTVRFDGQRPVGMVYRVMVDGKVVTGKLIGMY